MGWVFLALTLASCDAFVSPQQRIERARTDISAGQWGRAAIELRKVVQSDSGNVQAWMLLGNLSLDAADAVGAENALDHAMKAGAKGPELDSLRAKIWIADGKPQALIDAVAHGTITLSAPDRDVVLARAYIQLRQPKRALALLGPLLASHPRLTDARVAEARALEEQGNADAALHQLDVGLANDPHNYEPLLVKGHLLARRGDYGQAAPVLEASLHAMAPGTQLADRVAVLIDITEARLAQGEIDEAASSAAPLEKLLPQSPRVQVLSARIKLAHRDYLGGISQLERVVQRAPEYTQARMLLAAAHVERGDLEQARSQLDQIIQQAPDNIEARKLLASVSMKQGQPADALRALTPALTMRGEDPQMFSLLGEAEQRLGQSNSVTEALERAVKAHPENRNARLNLSEAYLAADRARDALPLLEQTPGDADLHRDALLVQALTATSGAAAATAEVEKLLAAHSDDRGMLNFAGLYYASQRQFDRARELIQRALGKDGRDISSLVNLARVDAAAGNTADAESALRTALGIAPGNLAVRLGLADVLISKRAFEQATRLLESKETSHTSPAVRFALARIELARGDTKKANAQLDQAIALAPNRAELVNDAGTLLLNAHQYDGALARFRRAEEMAPDNAELWLNVARAQLALNQPAAARESLEKASSLQPNWLPAVSALVLIDLRDKNGQSALGRAKALVAAHPADTRALVLEGDVEGAIGQPHEALEDYSAAQAKRPTSAVALKLFGVRVNLHDAHPEEPLQKWLNAEPADVAVRNVLGDYYLAKRNFHQAATEFESVVKEEPTSFVALNNLAWTYLRLNDPRAESVAEQAYRLAPQQANVEDTLGWILAQKHAADRALPLLLQALKEDADDPDLQYHYAYALAESGKRAEARQVLTKVLAAKRDFDSRHDAERLLAELKT